MSTDIVKAAGSLAIRPDQTEWTPEQAAVLQQSGISDEVTAAELSGFLHLCQRTQLDPFSRQIYLIGRKDKRAGRTVFTPQTGIDGYRVVAHRVVAASRESFGYEDTQWCDASGRWRDVWLANEPPAAAKVTVLRNGHRFPAIAVYREYVQTGWENKPIGLWGKMPASQLAKCAEALALRKAFPHDLAGVYTAEEMAQADNPAPERHLRSVQPGEPDQWATPGLEMQTTPDEPSVNPAAQTIADEAAKCKHRGEWRPKWALGKSGRLMEAPVKAPDTGAIEELGAYLTRCGTQLPEDPAAGQQRHQPTTAADEPVVDGEVVEDSEESEHAAAVAEFRQIAAKAGLDNPDGDAHSALGAPLDQASAAAIRNLTDQIRGAAA